MDDYYKFSKYNFFIPIQEANAFLVYNSRTNSLIETEYDKGKFLEESSRKMFNKYKNYITESELKILLKNGVLLKANTNENDIMNNFYLKKKNIIKNSQLFSLTIAPTLKCNMSCPYCFENANNQFLKKSNHKDFPVKELIKFVRREIENPAVGKLSGIKVYWFGGEPLLRVELIDIISSDLIKICNAKGMEYSAEIITNGTLINDRVIENLDKWAIKKIQVTLDGPKAIHDKKRPMNSETVSSFDLIIKNIKRIPENMKLDIRINVDLEVKEGLESFLKELDEAEIWPNRIKNTSLTLAKKMYHDKISKEDKSIFLTQEEFALLNQEWRSIKMKYYNNWAKKKNKRTGKIKFEFPKFSDFLCGSVGVFYSLVIDNNGDIHKCWEDLGNEKTKIQSIRRKLDFDLPEFKKWLESDKYILSQECRECKYLPICNDNCTKKHFANEFSCTDWKYTLEDIFKNQFLTLKNNPEQIMVPKELKGSLNQE